jgi:hypothetical protein
MEISAPPALKAGPLPSEAPDNSPPITQNIPNGLSTISRFSTSVVLIAAISPIGP